MKHTILEGWREARESSRKMFTILVDPDKPSPGELAKLAIQGQEAAADCFFVGGSLLTNNSLETCIRILRENSEIPVILFPGNTLQMSPKADAILFLSLISGRNPEMLIGRHVISAPYLKMSGLEILPTGYMLIDSGRPTAVSYMSNSEPIPADKDDIAACTALAGEMLGLRCIFMDGGSGAGKPVNTSMVSAVRQMVELPLILGGGITEPAIARKLCLAGADMIVVGNAIEKDPSLIRPLADAIHSI